MNILISCCIIVLIIFFIIHKFNNIDQNIRIIHYIGIVFQTISSFICYFSVAKYFIFSVIFLGSFPLTLITNFPIENDSISKLASYLIIGLISNWLTTLFHYMNSLIQSTTQKLYLLIILPFLPSTKDERRNSTQHLPHSYKIIVDRKCDRYEDNKIKLFFIDKKDVYIFPIVLIIIVKTVQYIEIAIPNFYQNFDIVPIEKDIISCISFTVLLVIVSTYVSIKKFNKTFKEKQYLLDNGITDHSLVLISSSVFGYIPRYFILLISYIPIPPFYNLEKMKNKLILFLLKWSTIISVFFICITISI